MVAGVVAAAPVILFSAAASNDDAWLTLWLVGPFVGPLVFQLISRPRPDWGWGLAFAAVLATIYGVWGGLDLPFEHSGAGQAAVLGAFIFTGTFMAGMVGASIASLIARLFDPDPESLRRLPRRMRPWHVGAAIAALVVLVMVVLLAESR
jgi:hypothetical protein